MADIRNINFGGIVPNKRMTCYNGQQVEIKRTYRIVKGIPQIIWNVGDIPPAVNEFMLICETITYNGQYLITIPILESDVDRHTGSIEWGDGQSGGYASNMRYTHYYDSAGIYTIKMYAPIEKLQLQSAITAGFRNVQYVEFPESLVEIGSGMFANNPILYDIDFNNVEIIGGGAFSGDSVIYGDEIQNIKGDKVRVISSSAFERKKKLISIDFPIADSISNNAFAYCTALENINIPAIKWISGYAFRNCISLKSIEIPDTIEEISYNHGLYTNAFEGCTNLRSIVINKPYNSIPGSPWGAVNAQILWRG